MENELRIKNCLNIAVSKTMEDMAFEEVERIEDSSIQLPPENPVLWATLKILQPIEGEISIRLSPDCGATLTHGLYGDLEGELSDNTINDALAEVVNTIAGCFMKELSPPTENFELGLPRVGRNSLADMPAMDFSITYDLSGQLMTVSMSQSNEPIDDKCNINGGSL